MLHSAKQQECCLLEVPGADGDSSSINNYSLAASACLLLICSCITSRSIHSIFNVHPILSHLLSMPYTMPARLCLRCPAASCLLLASEQACDAQCMLGNGHCSDVISQAVRFRSECQPFSWSTPGSRPAESSIDWIDVDRMNQPHH